MSIEQLRCRKEQVDMEVNLIQDSFNNIRKATARLEPASTALHELSLRPEEVDARTASLYVQETLDDADNILKKMPEGEDYCKRKINLLKSNYDQLLEVVTKKKSVADEAVAILQVK